VNVVVGVGDFAFEVDPPAIEAGREQRPPLQYRQLLLQELRGRFVYFVLFEEIYAFNLVGAEGGQDELGLFELLGRQSDMVELLGRQLDIFEGEHISSVPAHEFGGGLEDEAGLDFDEGSDVVVVLAVDEGFGSLRADNMFDEIRVGK